MTYDELLRLAKNKEGSVLTTIRGKKFKVGVYMDCPFFIPQSSGLGRSDGRLAAERFLDLYNRTGSPKTSDYQKVTRNASYFLALIHSAE
ncbi:MAG TPA: hypothetical protein VNI20_11550 [Fimbriimonadaceae bacterium]|nr:hypothetical protein [Fimbriimonadaceae bacterium]